MDGIKIRGFVTYTIALPPVVVVDSDDQRELDLRTTVAYGLAMNALGVAATSTSARHCLMSMGIDIDRGAIVRYSVTNSVTDELLQSTGERLTDSFYIGCGTVPECEQKRREAKDITGPLWTMTFEEAKQ